MRTIVMGTCLLLLTSPLQAGAESKIPYFARKYGVTCSQCHVNPPKLNRFGEEFIARGYDMPGLRPRRTWPFALWISGRSDSQSGPANVADDVRAYVNRVELISGGKVVAPWLSYFAEWRLVSQEGRSDGTDDDSRPYLANAIVTGNRSALHWTAMAGTAKTGDLLAGRWSLEAEFLPSNLYGLGGRVEDRAADGADVAVLPYLNAHFPGTRYTLRLPSSTAFSKAAAPRSWSSPRSSRGRDGLAAGTEGPHTGCGAATASRRPGGLLARRALRDRRLTAGGHHDSFLALQVTNSVAAPPPALRLDVCCRWLLPTRSSRRQNATVPSE